MKKTGKHECKRKKAEIEQNKRRGKVENGLRGRRKQDRTRSPRREWQIKWTVDQKGNGEQ